MSNLDPTSSGDAIADAPHSEGASSPTGDERLRAIPPVSAIVAEAKRLGSELTEDALTRAARAELEDVRQALLAGEKLDRPEIERRVIDAIAALERPRLAPVLNATGVVIHTNLGRAPVSPETAEAMRAAAAHPVPLEIDPESNERGGRMREIAGLLRALTGAESALVVNNCASAVLLVLAAVASGKEVVVSRGEAVEIGGGFRVPDVLRQSGARLVEVGTTNRTYARDYAAATTEETGAYLKVHPSNFRAFGFVHSASTAELVVLAREHGLPVLEDLGSGALLDTSRFGLAPEPTLTGAIAAGADLVMASADKLLGGPQGGIIVGSASLGRARRASPPGARGARRQDGPRGHRGDAAPLPARRGGIARTDLAHDRGAGERDPRARDAPGRRTRAGRPRGRCRTCAGHGRRRVAPRRDASQLGRRAFSRCRRGS